MATLSRPISFSMLVSDYGLRTICYSATANRSAGYQAPEVTDARKISQKADVYSFGVLLLELITGLTPSKAINNEDGVDLPRWVQSVVREEWTAEVFDPELLKYQNIEEEIVQVLQVAIDCTALHPDQRPLMSEVVSRIEDVNIWSRKDHQQQQESDDNDNTD